MAEPFLSEIRIMSFSFAPKGWALCNGQMLPINQNQALFSLLGTTYGGDGRVTFALPEPAAGACRCTSASGLTLRRAGRRGGAHADDRRDARRTSTASTHRRAAGDDVVPTDTPSSRGPLNQTYRASDAAARRR